ncbi:MAG: dihydroorotate dehydrogenase [bacterium]|nr:dihydroorotate dehydrogenase [bacterium]
MVDDLNVKIGSLKFKNPVMVASGTFGYGEEYAQLIDLNELGAIVTKSITLKPRLGNPQPRLWETQGGLLNSIGLQNVGLATFIDEKLPYLQKYDTRIIVSIAGESVAEYCQLAQALKKETFDALEVNISCPNVKHTKKGLFAQDKDLSYEIIKKVARYSHKPVIAKLTPNITDIGIIAKACERAGAEAIALVNTFNAMAIDLKTKKPVFKNIVAGLCGPAIKPQALYKVYEVKRAVKIPIIGMGGIMDVNDALEFIITGASAIAVGVGNFVDPKIPINIIKGLQRYVKENHISQIKELIGSID